MAKIKGKFTFNIVDGNGDVHKPGCFDGAIRAGKTARLEKKLNDLFAAHKKRQNEVLDSSIIDHIVTGVDPIDINGLRSDDFLFTHVGVDFGDICNMYGVPKEMVDNAGNPHSVNYSHIFNKDEAFRGVVNVTADDLWYNPKTKEWEQLSDNMIEGLPSLTDMYKVVAIRAANGYNKWALKRELVEALGYDNNRYKDQHIKQTINI